MERMKRAINEYDATIKRGGTGGSINTNDFNELKQLVEAAGGRADFWSMNFALKAGYMIGYRKAKREARNAKKSA